MPEETQDATPATPKPTRKGGKRSAKASAVIGNLPTAVAGRVTTADDLQQKAIAAIDDELRQLELETARINLRRARKENDKFEQAELSREDRFNRAQSTLKEQAASQANIKNGCEHKQGGFGLEDLYTGNGPSSLIVTDLPIAGRKYIVCTRCLGDWTTPDPGLKKTNPDLYVEQAAEFASILRLVRGSMAKPVGVPSFTFEKDGVPVHPPIR